MVNERGIEANPEKIKAILEMASPRTVNKVQHLAEIGKASHRVAHYDLVQNEESRLLELEVIEEKRDISLVQIQAAKGRMRAAYDKRVHERNFQVGDLVLKKVEVSKHVGKLEANWEGPFKVTKILKKITYRLKSMEGKELPRPWNIHNLRKFYT
ncbi:hypothetical protein DH2020_023122 [Rehmannia glutinosa]|uniref:Uncharacterized protein n=1 Tax=Rehmannia glutinosa TaxID=99300 RepID=A0ABR0W9K4_REHGL